MRTLTTDAIRGHTLGKNAYLVQVRPETDQNGIGGYTLLLRDPLHDFVVGEGSTGGPKRGVSRDGDPFRLGEFHELGLGTRGVKFDLIDCWGDGCVFQEPLEVAHTPVGNPDSLDLVKVFLIDLLDLLVNVQPVDLSVGLFILRDLPSDIYSRRYMPHVPHTLVRGAGQCNNPTPRGNLKRFNQIAEDAGHAQRSR